MAANHPTGIADGVAVYDAITRVRPDIAIFTNRDALRVNSRLSEFLIPVEWREAFRDRTKMRETLQLSSRAFKEGRAVVHVSLRPHCLWKDGRLNERPWLTSAVTLARKQDVPIVPVNVQSRNSGLFYWFANWNTELRDMTVFHELLNKRGKTFRIRFGPPIPQERFAEGDAAEVTQRLQAHVVERLAPIRRGILARREGRIACCPATLSRSEGKAPPLTSPSSASRRRRNRSSRRNSSPCRSTGTRRSAPPPRGSRSA